MINKRFEYNLQIIQKLKELIIKYPDMRFGQLLVNCDIIELVPDSTKTAMVALDPFNDESEVIWERVKNNKFAFKEMYN